MKHRNKGKAKYILAWVTVAMFTAITLYGGTTCFIPYHFHSFLTTDTVPVPKPVPQPGLPKKPVHAVNGDSVIVPKVDSFSYPMSKDSLDAPVTYHADDSMVLDVPTKKIILYGKQTKVNYIDNELTAPHIEFDQRTSLVSAYLTKDSTGKVISFPTFNQGDFKSVSDSILFNMKTGKGLTKGTYTHQGDMFVYGETIKKVSPDVFYAYRGRFTTCNLDTPHFAFVSNKIKFINKKMAFTGPVHPEIEGVPIPIVLPFGIYPLSTGRHSGLLAPTFTANEQLGLALDGLGYYKVISDNWDVVTRGTLYSYGGWTANISPTYYKRYHYRGNFSLNILHLRDLDKSGTRGFNILWSHSTDTKARPGVTFNANVNAGSSKFNESLPNAPLTNFTNQLNSSITYSKVWKDKPFSLTVSANHNQNTIDRLINLNLPDVGFNVSTLYPFRRKEPIGEYKWYENIGVAYNTNVKTLSSFYDTAGHIFQQLKDNLSSGADHNVPISLSLPPLGVLQLSPGVTYEERWFQHRMFKQWNNTDKKLDTTITSGFYTARQMSFSLGASTRIFGMYTFNKNSKIQAIRHEIRPTFAINYTPDMNGNTFRSTQIDTLGDIERYSVYNYRQNIFSGFSEGKFGGITFGVDNNLQMKVKNRKDTGEAAIKKITLIDGFSINGSYNFLRDSFKLDPMSVSLRTNLFQKVSITASGILDPYLTNENGTKIDKLVWTKHPFSLGKLSSANISVSSQFNGGDKTKDANAANVQQNQAQLQQYNTISGMPLSEYQQEAALISSNPGEYANFNIPWSVNFSYSLSYYRQLKADFTGFEKVFSQNVTFGGSLNLTQKWQMGLNGFYNLTTSDLGSLSMYLTREMHCWQMAINISPVGRYRYFNVSIHPKSGILRDLKVNRTRYFYDL